MRIESGLTFLVFFVRDHGGHGLKLGGWSTCRDAFHGEVEDALQIGELFGPQLAAFLSPELRNLIVGCGKVVVIPVVPDDEQVLCLGVFEEILEFMGTVMGVHGEQDGADLGCGKLECHPVGHVVGPDGDLFAFLYAESHQPFGNGVHEFAEFLVGLAKSRST